MTVETLARTLLRHPVVVLAGAVITGLLVFIVMRQPSVYSSRVDVVLIAPQAKQEVVVDRSISSSSEGLIAVAGLVERLYNADRQVPPATTQDVSLTGLGVRSGVLVRLPNEGGQWQNSFNTPTLSVQVVDASPVKVRDRREKVVAEILATLDDLQANVPPESQVRTRTVPERAPVYRTDGHPSRAAAALIVIGAALTTAAAVGADLITRRRRHARLNSTAGSEPVSRGEACI